MGSTAEPQLQTEEEGRIYSWRLEQLERLGYPTSDAAELALSPIDLHQLAALIRAGCPHELARKIAT